ncbi:hypothetical protein PVAND_006092 [Polypedilum vanderplanki]|uniref:BACK domain-containing protein n=1 Tax=Polypedilum vanderplanki TaxID=319348 RepID=A0A9J6C348_POLVA|nr:hypothetical protein PVAND_006092 [Polypedilum vanderplanki]
MLSKEKRVERNGLVKMLIGAEYLQIDFLIQQCWSLIQNSKWFSENQAFLLYKEALNSEIDAFYAAVRWLLYDWSARKKYLMDVMKCIRFGLIDTARIVILRQKNNNGQLNELLRQT